MRKIALLLLTLLLVLLPLHALVWTALHASYTEASWLPVVKIWKELVLALLGVLLLPRLPMLWRAGYLRSRVNLVALGFVMVASLVALLGAGEVTQKLYGARTLLLLPVAYLIAAGWQLTRSELLVLTRATLGVGLLVLLFGWAQQLWLPADFLKYLGYSEVVSTWEPDGVLPMYHLVGETGVIRLQSTLAGPNQLGAYTLLLLALAVGLLRRAGSDRLLGGALVLLALPVLYWTHSRSAWLGLLAGSSGLSVRIWQVLNRRGKQLAVLGGILVVVAAGVTVGTQTNLRESLLRSASSSEHLTRTLTAAKMTLANPLGLGLGSTAGGAQRYGDGLTPENMYLGATLETGWIGGALYVLFLVLLLRALWQHDSTLAYGLLGVMVVGVFLHPLDDATLAISLGVLAGSALPMATGDKPKPEV